MKRSLVSTLCGALALSAGYVGTSFDAQACRCLPPEITRDYASAQKVFTGQVFWEMDFFYKRFFLVLPKKSYKGCLDTQRWMWISTSNSSASCGANFEFAEEYLFFTSKDGQYGWSQSTSSCAGNRPVDALSESDLDFLNAREVCCGDSCACADGSAPVNCLVDPCTVSKPCKTDDLAKCEPNYCGGCHAEFFGSDGTLLCQGPASCRTSDDCKEGEYCGAQGECVEDGSCEIDAECNFAGNQFDYFVRCTGYGVCNEGKCDFECGSSNCVNHEGYDFGECEMSIGWLRVGDTCQNIESGCASLLPGGGSPFTSKQDCEEICRLTPRTFACGSKKTCEIGKSYCLETTPGVRPEPGVEVRPSYACQPLPESCIANPSCASCFESDPMLGSSCYVTPQGGLKVDLALP